MCAKDIIMLIWLLPLMNSLYPIVVIMDTMVDIKKRIYFLCPTIMDGIVPFAVIFITDRREKVSQTYDRKESTLYYWYYHVFLSVMNNSFLQKKKKK